MRVLIILAQIKATFKVWGTIVSTTINEVKKELGE